MGTVGSTGSRSGSPPSGDVRIQILKVPDCPLVAELRGRVHDALTRCGLRAGVEEVEGLFLSPTLLVNEVDVTGWSAPSGAACRLDLPTEGQIVAALLAAAGRG